MKFRLFRSRSWSISDLTPPWGDRKSIYWHIANHIQEDSLGLAEGGEQLPDEGIFSGDSPFKWLAGALDSVLGHPSEGSAAESRISRLYDSLIGLTEDSTDENVERLYNQLTSESVVNIIDGVLEKIVSGFPGDQERLHTVARWLAMEAADREAVKLAIAILGLFRDENDLDLLMTLGRHEEFTLFAVVAIQNSEVDIDDRLWKLAQHVRGWGRIHIVERLESTEDEYIRDWLVREGYRNDVMLEYTALICARAGRLREKLVEGKVDDEMIGAAGDILTAMLSGSGPAEGYESYEQGPEAYEAYLRILASRENGIDALVFADRMEQFLYDEKNFSELSPELKRDWNERRARMLDLISEIKSQPGWTEKTIEQIASTDRSRFWTATESAKVLGIDIWDHYFERIKNGEDYWWNALQTDDADRIDKLVAYAEATIPFEKIATGPSDSLGLGPEFAHHQKLDWLLQDLRRFPGKGLKLIHAGLKSPVVRNRNMAVWALAEIPIENRSDETQQRLLDACAIEPNDETKKLMEIAVKGERLADQTILDALGNSQSSQGGETAS